MIVFPVVVKSEIDENGNQVVTYRQGDYEYQIVYPKDGRAGHMQRYSTLKIKRALEAAGKWETVKAALTAAGVMDDFYLCNFIQEDDPAFVAARARAIESGLATAEEVAALLAACGYEED